MVLETHMKWFATAKFSGKIFSPQKMGQKQGFLNLLKKFIIVFLLNVFYNENVYYLLCSCTSLIFEKMFVPEI